MFIWFLIIFVHEIIYFILYECNFNGTFVTIFSSFLYFFVLLPICQQPCELVTPWAVNQSQRHMQSANHGDTSMYARQMNHLRSRPDGASSSEQLVKHAHVSIGSGLRDGDDLGSLSTQPAPLRFVRQISVVLWQSISRTWRRDHVRRDLICVHINTGRLVGNSIETRIINMLYCFMHKINKLWTWLSNRLRRSWHLFHSWISGMNVLQWPWI